MTGAVPTARARMMRIATTCVAAGTTDGAGPSFRNYDKSTGTEGENTTAEVGGGAPARS